MPLEELLGHKPFKIDQAYQTRRKEFRRLFARHPFVRALPKDLEARCKIVEETRVNIPDQEIRLAFLNTLKNYYTNGNLKEKQMVEAIKKKNDRERKAANQRVRKQEHFTQEDLESLRARRREIREHHKARKQNGDSLFDCLMKMHKITAPLPVVELEQKARIFHLSYRRVEAGDRQYVLDLLEYMVENDYSKEDLEYVMNKRRRWLGYSEMDKDGTETSSVRQDSIASRFSSQEHPGGDQDFGHRDASYEFAYSTIPGGDVGPSYEGTSSIFGQGPSILYSGDLQQLWSGDRSNPQEGLHHQHSLAQNSQAYHDWAKAPLEGQEHNIRHGPVYGEEEYRASQLYGKQHANVGQGLHYTAGEGSSSQLLSGEYYKAAQYGHTVGPCFSPHQVHTSALIHQAPTTQYVPVQSHYPSPYGRVAVPPSFQVDHSSIAHFQSNPTLAAPDYSTLPNVGMPGIPYEQPSMAHQSTPVYATEYASYPDPLSPDYANLVIPKDVDIPDVTSTVQAPTTTSRSLHGKIPLFYDPSFYDFM